MLSVHEARRRVLDRVRLLEPEDVPIDAARGRVLADTIVAGRALPPWDNSAMDGFAARAADLPGELPVVGSIAAGSAPDRELAPGTAVRIMTGAPLPRGADLVVMKEDASVVASDRIKLPAAAAGQHVRRAGEDIALGERVLVAGAVLAPGEIAVLASLGMATVRVGRRPRVAILSTGDELCPVGGTPSPGQIFSSNEHGLAAQAAEAGAQVVSTSLVRDDPTALDRALTAALEADVVITSGGVSVGDHDHVRAAMAMTGIAVDFWKVAMRPGKPIAFGVAQSGALVFGLPGNPVSSMVSFELFVRPALLSLAGASEVDRPRAEVILTVPVDKEPGRAHYLRAALVRHGDRLEARPHARQGSGMLSSLLRVDALLEVAAESGALAAGARCPALLLRSV